MYDCIGVVNHLGGTTGGHYVAYAKNSYDRKWRQYDDSHVKVVSHDDVQSRNAYIMFYVRRDLQDTGVEKMYRCKHPSQKERGEFKSSLLRQPNIRVFWKNVLCPRLI